MNPRAKFSAMIIPRVFRFALRNALIFARLRLTIARTLSIALLTIPRIFLNIVFLALVCRHPPLGGATYFDHITIHVRVQQITPDDNTSAAHHIDTLNSLTA